MQIPGYQIEKELGHGGMATVYLAVQESLHRKVALKGMSPALAADRSFSERFLREARTIAELNHPNIVAVHDVGIHDYAHYIAMEYIAGGELKQKILDQSIEPVQALTMVREVARALGYAHGKGYVHRDIKPENILFREDGSVAVALTDFGIAKSLHGTTKMTGTGMSIGTPHYMSPEQARGHTVDHRADLYSLGIVLYEMLTGQQPFDADDTMAIGIQHITAPVPQLPQALRSYQPLIDHLLAKEPGERLENADALIAQIDRFLSQGTFSVQAHRPKATGKQNFLWPVLGLGAVVLIATGVIMRQQLMPTVSPSVSATPAFTGYEAELPEVQTPPNTPVLTGVEAELLKQQTPNRQMTEEQQRTERLAALAQKQEIARLLKEANADIDALRLTSPAGNNALDKLQRVLALDNNNAEAEAGLARIVNRYLQLAESAANKQRFDTADGYIDTAEAILPGFEPARLLREKLQLWPGRVIRDKLRDGSLGPSMVVIPAGSFLMGSPDGEEGRDDDEGPQHKVTISKPFAMGKYAVTVAQFRAFITDSGYKTTAEENKDKGCYVFKDDLEDWDWGYVSSHNWRDPNYKISDTRLVTCVSWHDAKAYTQWLGKQTGKNYQLPSEAQWEYAARGGTTGARFWGAKDNACEYGNFADQTIRPGTERNFSYGEDCNDGYFYPAPVGTYKPNPFGLHDMLGNVWQWTEDCWHENYQGAPKDGSSWTTDGNCARRVVRGGSWFYIPRWVRAADRNRSGAANRNGYRGFRVSQVL